MSNTRGQDPSDREACDRLAFDLRWKAAAGLTVGEEAFHPTVLVGMRNRLRASDRPRRLFDDVDTTARAAGLLRGRRRVLDSTPLFDAVATQDTVIQLRAAIRKVLTAADRAAPELAGAVRAVLGRDDGLARQSRNQFVARVSLTPAGPLLVIDSIHPFREGNTRTETVFFHQLARRAGYELGADELRLRRTRCSPRKRIEVT